MPEREAAITTPFWDGFLSGGLSIALIAPILVLALAFGGDVQFVDADWMSLGILINATHFMASYRLLYVSKEQILGNRWSTIYIPMMLVAILMYSAFGNQKEATYELLLLGGSIYLAWHYTGQAWGMVFTFSYLRGVSYTNTERLCIRAGMRSLLVLHILFALSGRVPPPGLIDPATYIAAYGVVFNVVLACVVASFFAGVWAYASAHRRGQAVGPRAVIPWLSIFFWYPFWYFVPGGFVWVQLSHSLQYLAFPLRVEVNRYSKGHERTKQQKTFRALWVYASLALAGAFFMYGSPIAAQLFGNGWYSTPDARILFVSFTSCIGIHHYFIDGAIWKLSNPEVRKELFSHVA